MAHKLAEETIADILAYSLDVPDEAFASLDELSKSPFVNRQISSSTALVVCKRWMRIGTPLLYNTAVLRSTAQADALAFALKANPSFRPYVKKLRIEGGFGVSVRKTLEMAREITDLWLMLEYTSDDKAKPMCAALEKATNVRRLIMYRAQHYMIANNANTRLVMSTTLQCIMSWSSLRIIQLRGDTAVGELRRTLLSAKHLEEFRFSEDSFELRSFVRDCPPNIKRIRVTWPDPGDGYFRDKRVYYSREPERLPPAQLAKVVFAPSVNAACIAPAVNPFYVPMQHAPFDVRRKIWSHVFELLFEDYRCSQETGLCADWGLMRYGLRRQCMLICTEFRDVVTELACRQVKLWSSTAEGFAMRLKKMPHLSPLVETMDLHATCSSFFYEDAPQVNQCFKLVQSFIPELVNLRAFRMNFHDYPLQIKQLAALAPISEALVELQLHLGKTQDDRNAHYLLSLSRPQPPVNYQLLAFSSLKKLSFMINKDAAKRLIQAPSRALNALEVLHLEGRGCADFLRLISPLRLETLHTLEVAWVWDADAALEDFCAVHGHKLSTLSIHEKDIPSLLKYCPNVEFLVYPDDGEIGLNHHPTTNYYTSAPLCPRVKEISYPEIDLRLYGRGDKQRVQEVIGGWTDFFNFMASTPQFPALKVVRVANRHGLWPTTEKEIAKSPLPGWAEKLLERGIRLEDANGVGWTPRLKPQKKAKQ